jgi:anti-anti-sigma factor
VTVTARLSPGSDVFAATLLLGHRTATVVVRGEVDVASEHEFAAVTADAAALEVDTVTYDLSEVTFFGSAGVRGLLEARGLLGARFRLGRCAPPVARVLAITGTDTVLRGEGGSTAQNGASRED